MGDRGCLQPLLLTTETTDQFHDMLHWIAGSPSQETKTTCLRIVDLLVSKELENVAEMERQDAQLKVEAATREKLIEARRAQNIALGKAGAKFGQRAEESLAVLQSAGNGGPFLKAKEAEQKVVDNHEVADRIRGSLVAMEAAEADIEAKAAARARSIHLEGRGVAETIAVCHGPLGELLALGLEVSKDFQFTARHLSARGEAYLAKRSAFLQAKVEAGDWSELFWQLTSHFGKMRGEGLLSLCSVASAIADPGLKVIVKARTAAENPGTHDEDYAVSAGLVGFLCRLESFETAEKQDAVFEFLLEVTHACLELRLPDRAQALAEELVGTFLAFVTSECATARSFSVYRCLCHGADCSFLCLLLADEAVASAADFELLTTTIQDRTYTDFFQKFALRFLGISRMQQSQPGRDILRYLLLAFDSYLETPRLQELAAEWVYTMHSETYEEETWKAVRPTDELDFVGGLLVRRPAVSL